MKFKAFILSIALTSLLISACGNAHETSSQPSETAPVVVQKTPTPMSFPMSTVESTATQPSSSVPLESTSTLQAPITELHGRFLYNDSGKIFGIDLRKKEDSLIIEKTEGTGLYWYISGPSANNTIYITYTGKSSNNTNEIYELDPTTKNLKRITWDSFHDYYLTMSSDGRYLAYISDWEGGSDATKRYKLNILNTQENRIYTIAERAGLISEPVWSPDSKKIAFIDLHDELNSVEIIDIDSREATQYPIDAIDISWSPDGTQLAIAMDGSEKKGIYILDTTTGEIVQEINIPSTPVEIVWSPVDNTIVFQLKTKVNGNRFSDITSLNLLDLKTSKTITVQDGGIDGTWDMYNPLWSKDGKFIAYFTEPENVNFWSVDDQEPILTIEHSSGGIPADAIWIYPKVIIGVGNDYLITEEGDNLNLREEPSVNSQILRKIRAGEKVTIIGGPENSDGYTWWQIKTEDDLLGWAVENEDWYEPAK